MADLCLVIPVFNHQTGICNTINKLRDKNLPCIVVDDGSDRSCGAAIEQLAQRYDWLSVIRHTHNLGKGRAVKSGLLAAREQGYSHVLQLDADEQHDLSALDPLIKMSQTCPDHVILGVPQYDESASRMRLASRYVTHVWVWINTLSITIRDSMCGFRIYPVASVTTLIDTTHLGDRMEFDIEVLVKLYWRGQHFRHVRVNTRYPDDGVSHFRLVEDNWRITKMHTRLFFGMLLRLPLLLARAIESKRCD